MIMKQRGFSSLPWLNRWLSQTTLCTEKVKLIMWDVQVTNCCGKSVISVFVHFVLWGTIVRKHIEISCQSFANAFVGHLFEVCASLKPRRLWSMNIQTVHAGLRCNRRQNNGMKIKTKRKGNVGPLLPPRSCCSLLYVCMVLTSSEAKVCQVCSGLTFSLSWNIYCSTIHIKTSTFPSVCTLLHHIFHPTTSTLPLLVSCFFWGCFNNCLSLTLFAEPQQ